jgi:hypothetical protein
MSIPVTLSRLIVSALAAAVVVHAQAVQTVDVPDVASLDLVRAKADIVTYQGRRALRLAPSGQAADDGMAVVKGVSFQDGELVLDVAGARTPGASDTARGFVGVAFRVVGPEAFEQVYLRPTNARAEDQVRRNHTVQYSAIPDFPWPRLRKEFPERYETYVDMAEGEWTRMRLVVQGTTARLFVHDPKQPTLVVNDLKRGAASGGIALWIGPEAIGHFAGLAVRP